MNSNQNPLDHPSIDADEARIDFFDATFPEWEVREGMGDRFVSEGDMPVWDEAAAQAEAERDAWDGMAEAMWSHPAERNYF